MGPDLHEPVGYPILTCTDLTVPDFYRELQQRGPLRIQMPFGPPSWLATRYDDVKTVFGDRRFGKEIAIGTDWPRMWDVKMDDPDMMANMDPPRLTRLRRQALVAFAAPRIRTLREWMSAVVDEYLDRFEVAGPKADFVSTVSWDVPLQVLSNILGVRQEDIPLFRAWVDQLMGPSTTPADRGHAHHNLIQYVAGVIADRRVNPTDDFVSGLVNVNDDDALSESELVPLVVTLFLGGFETTAAQIGSTVFTLMSQRDRWQELLDDRELMPAALEELWRWIPSFRFGVPMIRFANEDVELSGDIVIPKGDGIVAENNVANRDEAVFPHGWELDFHREDPAPHLALAWGAHRCLGAHLAHLEIELVVERMLDRFPSLELAIAPDAVKWSETSFLRSPAELPLTW
jgi:cytochrome P450